MVEELIERINERMTAMGKNPSLVALDAGLGRSAVRDILSGKARNPGIMTISAIARALDCSAQYLMGDIEEAHAQEADDILVSIDARLSDVSGKLEAGVFRQIDIDLFGEPLKASRIAFRSKRRYVGRDLYLYEMGDNSLDEKHIVAGDLLTAVLDPHAPHIRLEHGMLVIVARGIPGIGAQELSARYVHIDNDGITLICRSSEKAFKEIVVGSEGDEPNVYADVDGGRFTIEGRVVALDRRLDL